MSAEDPAPRSGDAVGSAAGDAPAADTADRGDESGGAQLGPLLRNAPVAIAMFDREMRYLLCSERWISDYRLEGRQVLGRSHYEVFPEIGEDWKAIHRRCLAGETARRDRETLERADGSFHWLRWEVHPWREADGSVGGIVMFTENIEERVHAEEALRLSEETFRGAFDHAPIGLALVAPDGKFLRVNPALCALVGFDEDELLRTTFQEITHPEDLDEDLALLAECLAGARQDYQIEKRYVRKSGDAVLVSLSVSLVRIEGRPRFFVSQIQDLTARRRAEAERLRAEEQLQQALKIEAIGRLAGGVAHDFNNLLGVITGFVELSQQDLPASHPVQTHLQEVAKGAARAAELTRQLLAFSRKQVMRPHAFDLNALVGDLEGMLRRLTREDIEIELRLDPGIGWIHADPTQLHQVIVNLVVNASDAMPDGGRLTIETGERDLDAAYISSHPPVVAGDYILLAVSDTGIGIDPETQRRIFEPFFTTKPEGAGTGLGLSTVYGIVKQSGGYIWVYSELGRGTTFKIYLPRTIRHAEPVDSIATSVAQALGHESILVVEDMASLREMIRRILVSAGYAVLEAADGEAALAIARSHEGPIDLLLTDVVMPKLSGPDLARELRTIRPGTRVLFMSGYSANAISSDGNLLDGASLLEKPLSGNTLRAAVRAILDRPAS